MSQFKDFDASEMLLSTSITMRAQGNDFWTYGVESTRDELETMTRYAVEQGWHLGR